MNISANILNEILTNQIQQCLPMYTYDTCTCTDTHLSGVHPMNASASMNVITVIKYINSLKSLFTQIKSHTFIYICVTCTHICVSIDYAINGSKFFKSSLLTYRGYKHQAHIEVGIEESSLRNQQALRQEDKLPEGRDSCLTGAWRRAVHNDCATLRPSVFRQPRKPTVTGPPRSLVPAVMERGPRGPYLRLCGPVAAWAHSRADWCRFGPHTLERKAPGEDALEEPRRTAWRPTCKPQGALASGLRGAVSGAQSQGRSLRGAVSRPTQWMLGAWGRIRADTGPEVTSSF